MKNLVAYITSGYPEKSFSIDLALALGQSGVDTLELGVPFSDPEAEGPAIQKSSERALANGVTLVKVLEMVREFRQQDSSTPIVLMGYLNSLLAMEDFGQQAQQAAAESRIFFPRHHHSFPASALALRRYPSARPRARRPRGWLPAA